jgi:hypothetical protein
MRRGDVLMISGLLATLGVAALTAPRLARLLPRQAAEPEGAPERRRAPADAAAGKDAGKKISVKLYFEKEDQPALLPEQREIAYAADLSQQIRTVVEELIKGSAAGHLPPLPPATKVHGVFVSARGTAYVDLSKEASAGGAAGSLGERLSVYALVDSITANFPAIRRVQILVDDRPAETLSGHLDLSRPLPADMTLIAVEAPPLQSAPGEVPAVPPPATPPPAGSHPSDGLPG